MRQVSSRSPAFLRAMDFVLTWEVGKDRQGKIKTDGGLNDRDDPGNPGAVTKWGFRQDKNPDLDVKNMTLDDAIEEYGNRYWKVYSDGVLATKYWGRILSPTVDLELLDPATAIVVCDSGVNCGVVKAHNWWRIGSNATEPIKSILEQRKNHYDKLVLENPAKYRWAKGGWMNRLADLRKLVDIMNAESTTKPISVKADPATPSA